MAKIFLSNKNGTSSKRVTTTYSHNGDDYVVTTEESSSNHSGLKVFSLICCVLLLSGLLSLLLQKGQTVTFVSLLQYMSDAPSVSHVFSSFETIPQIVGDYGILDIFIIPLNATFTILNCLIFFFKLISNSLDFVIYIVLFFF